MSSEEIRPLAARSDLMGAAVIAHAYGVVALSIAVFHLWPNAVTFLLAVILIGSRQRGLAILMHDAAHRALFRTGWLNEFAGTWICGNPILADMSSYRHYHLTHHRFTQTEGDPDLVLSRPFPTTRASLLRKFLRDLTGRTGVKQVSAQIALSLRMAGDEDAIAAARQSQAFKGGGMRGAVLTNLVIFALMWGLGAWWYWLAFWLLPLLTWFQLVLRIRNIAEHALTEFSDDPFRNVRTTRAGWLARALVAPYWVNYHLEHHMVMHVPCWNLRKMHELLLAKGHGEAMTIAPGYLDVLRQAGWTRQAG